MNALSAVEALANLTSVLMTVSLRLQTASQTLQRAHTEGWTQDDPRWTQAFSEADDALKAALERLK
jgi:hypothetical protein